MGIDITTQVNEQECGVCVLTSLHNYFYDDRKVTKEQVLDESSIYESGLSIFDFEVLAKKLELECESYEVKWSEFINLKINNYFVALVKAVNGLSHYVIVKKKKKGLKIYDSCSNQVNTISYSEFEKVYLDVVIFVSKKPSKLFKALFNKPSTVLLLDLKFVLINLLLSTLILIASIFSANFLNWIIDKAIQQASIKNIITICFIFLFVYLTNNILTYMNGLYSSSKVKTYTTLFISKILDSLKLKDANFFTKIDKNWIYKIDECVYNIANFYVVETNKFISNIIFAIACICAIGVAQYYLLIPIAAVFVLEVVFFLFSYKKKKDVFVGIARTENKNSNIFKSVIHNIEQEIWQAKKNNIIHELSNNYSNLLQNFHELILFKNNSEVIKSIFKSVIEVISVGLMGYLIITNNKLTVGTMTFVIASFSLFKTSLEQISSFFLSKIEFDVYWQVYKDLTTINNQQQSLLIPGCKNVKNISFFFENNWIELETKKENVIPYKIINIIKNHQKILIDKIEYKSNSKLCENNFIILDQNSQPSVEYVIKLSETDPITLTNYLKFFSINLNDKIDFYDGLILNLISLILEKNKVIFIDSIMNFIKNKDLLVVKEILNKIRKNNCLIICRKEANG